MQPSTDAGLAYVLTKRTDAYNHILQLIEYAQFHYFKDTESTGNHPKRDLAEGFVNHLTPVLSSKLWYSDELYGYVLNCFNVFKNALNENLENPFINLNGNALNIVITRIRYQYFSDILHLADTISFIHQRQTSLQAEMDQVTP